MAKKKTEEQIITQEEGAKQAPSFTNLIKKLNKSSEGKFEVYSGKDAPQISGYITTGNDILDIIVSNKINGGIPIGRITTISGLESSGKSLLAAAICANCQKMGGISIYFDVEHSVNTDFFKMLGVDIDKLILYDIESLEDIYSQIELVITEIRTNYNQKDPICIVVDSMTSSSADEELDSTTKFSLTGYSTHKSRLNSKSIKQIASLCARQNVALVVTTQLRQKLGAMANEDPYVESNGGYALQFYATLRLRLTKSNKIYKNIKNVKTAIGKAVKLVVAKSKLGTEFNTMNFNILYSSGLQNYNSWFDILKKYGIISGGAGGNYVLNLIDNNTGEVEEIKFKTNDFIKLMSNNNELKQKVLNAIGAYLMVQYEGSNDEQIMNKEDIHISTDNEENDVLEDIATNPINDDEA